MFSTLPLDAGGWLQDSLRLLIHFRRSPRKYGGPDLIWGSHKWATVKGTSESSGVDKSLLQWWSNILPFLLHRPPRLSGCRDHIYVFCKFLVPKHEVPETQLLIFFGIWYRRPQILILVHSFRTPFVYLCLIHLWFIYKLSCRNLQCCENQRQYT